MNKQINVTEEDLFRFIHSPQSLSKEMFEYISNNENRFKDELDLIKEAFDDLETISHSNSESIIKQIANFQIIELLPSIMQSQKEDGVKLAASSVVQLKPSYPMSFQSGDEKYLIRLVEDHSHHFLYLFTEEKLSKKLIVKFYPSENVYQINDQSKPLEILNEQIIEKVTIEKL